MTQLNNWFTNARRRILKPKASSKAFYVERFEPVAVAHSSPPDEVREDTTTTTTTTTSTATPTKEE